MASSVEVVRAWTDRYNDRDWERWLDLFSPDIQFHDLAQGVTVKGRDELRSYGQAWVSGFSDIAYHDLRLSEAGDRVLLQFMAVGTNDGAYGPLPATGKSVNVPVVNVVEFDRDSKVTKVEQLYDRLSILVQLGHIAEPA